MRSSVLLVAALLFSPALLADAEADINYRQGVMRSVGGSMSSMAAILRGGVHAEDLQFHANTMGELANIVPKVFPEGSGDGKTEALPDIWEDPEAFKERLDDFVEAAKAMPEAVASGDRRQIGGAIQTLGEACKGCHDNFREEHDH